MRAIRTLLERLYERRLRDKLFEATRFHPSQSHDAAVVAARLLAQHETLAHLLLEFPAAHERCPLSLTNGAGSNKDGLIPPTILYLLGFDVDTIGTVGHDPWPGNAPPDAERHPPGSLRNWIGLRGMGSKKVKEILDSYGSHIIPYNINIMATPNKEGEGEIDDILATIEDLLPHMDRAELNISCPNTSHDREAFQRSLDRKLNAIGKTDARYKRWRLKLSPDATNKDYREV